MADKSSSQLVSEKVFPVAVRQAVNYLWRLCRPLREVRGVEPIRVDVADSNIVVYLNEEAQAALVGLIESGGAITTLNDVEIYIASDDSVVTVNVLISS
jgi:hypothetical protein